MKCFCCGVEQDEAGVESQVRSSVDVFRYHMSFTCAVTNLCFQIVL